MVQWGIWCGVSLAQGLGKWKRVGMIGGAEILRCAQDDRLGGGEEFQILNFRFEIRRKTHDEEGVVVATQQTQVQKAIQRQKSRQGLRASG
jgi:hypothetical protein